MLAEWFAKEILTSEDLTCNVPTASPEALATTPRLGMLGSGG
jgi:hypothetical protein